MARKARISELAIVGYKWPTNLMRVQTVDGSTFIAQRIKRKWYVYKVGEGRNDPPESLGDDLTLSEARRIMRDIVECDLYETVFEPLEL